MKPMLKRNNRNQKFSRNHGNNRYSGKSLAAQRNTLQQNFEKYINLAREASSTGDKILAENYYQFAEHYLRTLNDMKPIELEIPTEEALNSAEEVICEEISDDTVAAQTSEDQMISVPQQENRSVDTQPC